MDVVLEAAPAAAKERDPGWDRYFVWPQDYFPIRLPSCVIERTQEPHDREDEAIVIWQMDRGLPLLACIDDAEGHVLEALVPQPGESGALPGGCGSFEVVHTLSSEPLQGTVGLAFTWAFFVPLISYIPRHPLGVVKAEGASLQGKRTRITIRDTRTAPLR